MIARDRMIAKHSVASGLFLTSTHHKPNKALESFKKHAKLCFWIGFAWLRRPLAPGGQRNKNQKGNPIALFLKENLNKKVQ